MKNDRLEEYSLLNNAYYGDGGFLNGKYLVQHPRESSEKISAAPRFGLLPKLHITLCKRSCGPHL